MIDAGFTSKLCVIKSREMADADIFSLSIKSAKALESSFDRSERIRSILHGNPLWIGGAARKASIADFSDIYAAGVAGGVTAGAGVAALTVALPTW